MLLAPWWRVFTDTHGKKMQTFTDTQKRNIMKSIILPKLYQVKLVIDPANQDFTIFDCVMQWEPLVDDRQWLIFFEKWFFVDGRWLLTLHQWLSSENADYQEIVTWYKHWKRKFTQRLLSHPRILAQVFFFF